MKVSDALRHAARLLERAGVAEPVREAGSLMVFAIERERVFLFSHPEYQLSGKEQKRFDDALDRIGRDIVDAKTIMLLQWAALRGPFSNAPLRG